MDEELIETIKLFSGNLAPLDYFTCEGQPLSIANYNALFASLETNYCRIGIQNCGLPELSDRVANSQGSFNQQVYPMGQLAGKPTTILLSSNMSLHTNSAEGVSIAEPIAVNSGDTNSPVNTFLPKTRIDFYSSVATLGGHYGFCTSI